MILYKFLNRQHPVSPTLIANINHLLSELNPQIPTVTPRVLLKVAKKSLVLLAIDSSTDTVVGLAILTVSHKLAAPDFGTIEDVVVDSSFRGRGIGKNLILKLITKARRQKLSYLELTSRPSRTIANRLYQSLGFSLRASNPYRLILK